MSPDVPLFMQVFCACLSFITGGAAKSFDPGRPKLRYDTGLPRHFCVGGVSGQFAEGTSTLEHRHVDGLFHFPSGGTMTSRRMLTRDHLHAINACPSPTGFSGHGSIAETMSPDVPLFMQVGDHKNGFHSNVLGLIVLPCPRVVFDCICECFSIAGLLLGLSGDVEKNPGPITEDLCRELLQNQKEILSKLTAVQEKQDSFETRFLEMPNRLLVIETKVQSLDETRNRLATLEETVAGRSLETSSLVKQVDDLDNRSRRNNLIIRGVAEEENEKEETLVRKVKDDIFNATLKVNVNSIDRIHRLGKKLSGRTRPVILSVADYRDKIKVLQNCSKLKDTDYSISEDFSKRVQGIRKKLWDSAGDERKAGKKVKLVFDKLRVNNTLYSWNEEREERCKLGSHSGTRDNLHIPGRHVGFKIINVNARSVLNKTHSLEALVIDHEPDIAVITETWLHKNIPDSEITPPGYTLVRRDRDGRGGGVALLVKRNIVFSPLEVPACKELERVGLARLEWIVVQMQFFPEEQSGFRRYRCTADSIEDVLATLGDVRSCGDVVMLLLLDVESPFDGLSHSVVEAALDRLVINGCLRGFVIAFLTERTFRDRVAKELSEPRDIPAGVPQRSVLSPLLFIMALAGLPASLTTAARFAARCSIFADDVALWVQGPRR
ncbi:uncharacterized protein LOC119432614 [Dermacentor silvarum]|uniref:uncharacterized protein LOC119432614 n=1 Tax=Dermacentor silvarum TaxID=543639 RepID=UPI0021017ED7|nr:uncharacterized protein LOC119432614 [Dermacentor silvarum]